MKRLILALMLVAAFALTAYAFTPPPAQGGYLAGWGMNPTNWNAVSGSWSAWGIYDPNQGTPGNGGDNWVVGYTWPGGSPVYIDYDAISLELWVEMYALQTYQYTSYQWHRLGNLQETINFSITGLLQSNNGQWVSLVYQAPDSLNKLWFKHDVLNRTGSAYGTDLPITWTGSYGNGSTVGQNVLWTGTMTPNPDLDLGPIPACDHWFSFAGSFALPYHVADGYYALTIAGCPRPEL